MGKIFGRGRYDEIRKEMEEFEAEEVNYISTEDTDSFDTYEDYEDIEYENIYEAIEEEAGEEAAPACTRREAPV